MEFTSVVLSAGKGKRLSSDLPKVLHPLAGKPLIHHVITTAVALGGPITVIVGHGAKEVIRALPETIETVNQGEPGGTGHALLVLLEKASSLAEEILILSGDVPLIRKETLSNLLKSHEETRSDLTILTCTLPDAGSYGRIIRDEEGSVRAIREAGDATEQERRINEVNTGIYVVKTTLLRTILPRLTSRNVQGEIYLTDAVEGALKEGYNVSAHTLENSSEMQGVNTRKDLALVHKLYYRRTADHLMESGVTLLDPSTTYVDAETSVGRDTIIHPGVHLKGCTVGARCVIHPNNVITGCTVGDECVILPSCVLEESQIGARCSIGPFAHLRPGCLLGESVRFGNFVEGKKARLADGVKAGHLTYLGDCVVGAHVNVGCGTITCNYDGEKKHQTVIEEGAFIGSDTQLVAPVTVGRGAYVGAGSTITKDVPAHALAIARGRQRTIEDWALKKKEKA